MPPTDPRDSRMPPDVSQKRTGPDPDAISPRTLAAEVPVNYSVTDLAALSMTRATVVMGLDGVQTAVGVVAGFAAAGVVSLWKKCVDVADRLAAVGSDIGEAGLKVADSAANFVEDVTEGIIATGSSIGRVTAEAAAEGFISLFKIVGDTAAVTADSVAIAAHQLTGEPGQEAAIHEKGVRLAIGLLPVVGGLQGIAEARNKFREAEVKTDQAEREALMAEARRDCLVQCASLSLDLATAGVAGLKKNVFDVCSKALSVLNGGRVASKASQTSDYLPSVDLDFLSRTVDLALGFPPLREAMEIILRHEPNPTATAHVKPI